METTETIKIMRLLFAMEFYIFSGMYLLGSFSTGWE